MEDLVVQQRPRKTGASKSLSTDGEDLVVTMIIEHHGEPTVDIGEAELKRRSAMLVGDFERAYPLFEWSERRTAVVLTDREGRRWMPRLAPTGCPYDLESSVRDDEADHEAYSRFLDYRRAGGRMIPLEELEHELDVVKSRDCASE